MQIQLVYQPPAKPGVVTTQAGKPKVEVRMVEGGPVIFAADPVSWAVLAIAIFEKFAGSFADAAGKELGSAFGKWVAERLGFEDGPDAKQIKAILDEYTRRVIESIKQQFVEQQFRIAHERLAATSRQLEGFLLAPKTESLDGLTNLDLEVSRVYEELKNLGPGALPSLARAGVMLITTSVRIFGKTKDKGQKQIILSRISEVLKDIDGRLTIIEEIYKNRVIGPYFRKIEGACRVFDPPIKGTGLELEMMRVRFEPYEIDAIGVLIDGKEGLYHIYTDYCKNNKPDRHAQAQAEANAFAEGQRRIFNDELEREYQLPAAGVRTSAEKLKEKINATIK